MAGLSGISGKVGVDAYTMRARVQPGLLVALPVALVVLVFHPSDVLVGNLVWTVAAWAGGTALVAQLARDRGKEREPVLFEEWGGKPTVVALRHAGSTNPTLLTRRHAQLERHLPGLRLPTAAEEAQRPAAADAIYESCTAFLRDRTREHARFPLVFEENCNYGFRRNVWGLKPFGITTSLIGVAASGVALALAIREGQPASYPAKAASGAICLLLLLVWLFVVTKAWVRVPAEAYGERLLEAIDSLS